MADIIVWFFWFIAGFFPSLVIKLYATKIISAKDLIITGFGSIFLGPLMILITVFRLNPNTDIVLVDRKDKA